MRYSNGDTAIEVGGEAVVRAVITVEAGDNAAADDDEIEAGDSAIGLSNESAAPGGSGWWWWWWCKTGTYRTWAYPYPPPLLPWPLGTATGTVKVKGTAATGTNAVWTRLGS